MVTLSKIALVTWGVFVVFVASALFNLEMPIYWLWLVLGIAACLLLINSLRAGHRYVIVNAGAPALFLTMFVVYWIAIDAAIYGDMAAGPAVGNRIENVMYVILGNFQQGQIWRGLQSTYVQLLMPTIQLVLLITTLILRSGSRNRRISA